MTTRTATGESTRDKYGSGGGSGGDGGGGSGGGSGGGRRFDNDTVRERQPQKSDYELSMTKHIPQ